MDEFVPVYRVLKERIIQLFLDNQNQPLSPVAIKEALGCKYSTDIMMVLGMQVEFDMVIGGDVKQSRHNLSESAYKDRLVNQTEG